MKDELVQQLTALAHNAPPKLSESDIEAVIECEDCHVFPLTTVTVCAITLRNGFTVIGHSACVSPAVFNAEIGRAIARKNARDKIWELEGYLLKQREYERHVHTPVTRETLRAEINRLGEMLDKMR